ncbi:MAG: Ig-like domain repeat protein [Acidobacteriaceae bacterium]
MVVLAALTGVSAPRLAAQAAPLVVPYTITTIGGGTTTVCTTAGVDKIGNGCPATQASFGATSPVASGGDTRGIGVDSRGNIIIADTGANMVRKINPKTGLVTVVAGSLSSAAACTLGAGTLTPVDKYGDGCVASDGTANLSGGYTGNFNKPRGVYVAPNGDIFIAGYGDYMIHKISAATGVMSIVAGYVTCTGSKYTSCAGTEGYTGDGGTATNYEVQNGTPMLSPTGGAELYQPRGVAADSFGNVYIADTGDNAIRVVYEGGATLASLIATEVPGTVAVAGDIYTIAGNPLKTAGGGSGSANANGTGVLASAAFLNTPEDVIVDSNGNIFIADEGNHVVRVIYVGGTKVASLIALENPGVAAQAGDIYTVMGGGSASTYTAGTSVAANSMTLGGLRKIAMDSRGDLFAIDNTSDVVWFEDASTGYIRAIAGQFGVTYTANPSSPVAGICTGATDNIGDGCPATTAVFSAGGNGMGMAIDGQDNIYITDPADARIRKVSINTLFAATTPAAPETQTIDVHLGAGVLPPFTITFPNGNPDFSQAGSPTCSTNADSTVDCQIGVIFQPSHPGADPSSLLISGTTTGALVGLNGTGTVATVSIDPGTASALVSALSSSAQQVAVDGGGNTYVADTGNNQVLYYPASGSAGSVVAGGNGAGYSGDNGSALAAKLSAPKGVAVDAAGNLYIADTSNNVVRRVDRVSQTITTLAGGATSVCPLASDIYGDSCPAAQTILSAPAGVATDAIGNLYISDGGHNLIRQIAPNGYSYLYAGGTVCSGATDTYGDGCSATQATFSSPAGLTVDGSSNLYIADAGDNLVREVAYVAGTITAVAGNGQAGFGGDGGLATRAQLSGPQGVAVDAAGDVFIADTGNDGLRIVNQASGNISTLAGVLGSSGTGTVPGAANGVLLSAPRGVAVNGQGTLTLADSANGRLLQIQRSRVVYNFGTVNVGSSSDTQVFDVTSTGTVAAAITSPAFTTASGAAGDLPLAPTTTQGCSSGSLAAGAFCSMIGEFSPTAAAAETAAYTLSSNAANTTVPAIVLSGTGKFLISTSVAVVQTVPASGSPQYGQGITVAAKVTPSSTTVAMTGTITFKVDGVAGVPVPIVYAGGVATASFAISSQSVGSHTVTAIYSGDFNYAASNNNAAPLTISVSKASTATVTGSSPASLLQFSSETLTATVASTTTGTPTGTVSFYNGTTLLGTSSLNSGGVATFTSAILAVGSYGVTGVYSGDSNYSTSTSAASGFTVNADPQDFQLSLSTASVAVASGSTVQTYLYVSPTNTLAGTLTFACTGLPQYATCTFGPPSTLAVTAVTNTQTYWQQPIQVQVTFWSDVAPIAAASPAERPGSKGTHPMLAFGWPVVLVGLGRLARRRLRRSGAVLWVALFCLLAAASMTLSGCNSAINGVRYTTPAGTSNVTITVTGPGSASHTIPVQYTITGPGF